MFRLGWGGWLVRRVKSQVQISRSEVHASNFHYSFERVNHAFDLVHFFCPSNSVDLIWAVAFLAQVPNKFNVDFISCSSNRAFVSFQNKVPFASPCCDIASFVLCLFSIAGAVAKGADSCKCPPAAGLLKTMRLRRLASTPEVGDQQ